MEYEIALALRLAGFKFERLWQGGVGFAFGDDDFLYVPPNLSELVRACGPRFDMLALRSAGEGAWEARGEDISSHGTTPEEAVARLWLALNNASRVGS